MMTTPALIYHQFRFDQKRFWRDPAGLFYAIGFPLVFLAVFLGALGNNNETAHIAGHTVSSKIYYVPGIMAMTVVSVAFASLAISLTAARERGTLKRVRGTRLPPWVFMAGRIATAVAVTAGTVMLVAVTARLVYDVPIPVSTLGAGLVMLLVAAAAFCALGFAITTVLPSANTAAAVTMTGSWLLYFISGLFAREDNIPDTLRTIAGLFPIKRLFQALVVAYDPATTGVGFAWTELGVLAAWGVGALVIALRLFRWTPTTG
jgi:ABC-2 type transport system permease protein